jgi:hypothetical protein
MTLKLKIEKWLQAALAEVATDHKLRIYTGADSDKELVRPCLVIVANREVAADGMVWEDGERTITATVSCQFNTASKPATIDAAWEAVENAFADVYKVTQFHTGISGLHVHRYSIESIEYGEPEERHTAQSITLSIMGLSTS